MYDAEGITGFCVGKYDDIYRYIKDASDNVIAILYKNNEVAMYEYDAWGKCTVLNPDGTKNTSAEFIGNSNPIRWKSQYYDQESDLYYINGRYYSPEIRRYLNIDKFSVYKTNAHQRRKAVHNNLQKLLILCGTKLTLHSTCGML